MASKFSITIFVLLTVYSTITISEKMRLICDELGMGIQLDPMQPTEYHELDIDLEGAEDDSSDTIYGGIYCTVSDFLVQPTTQVDCNVYPMERDHVKVVRFTNSEMLYIPHGIFRYFINIREFDISTSKIETIHRGDFESARNLVFLIISHNNLTELGASLFVDAPTLTVIDLSYNHIAKINKYAFAEARSISRLVFSYNNITTLDERLFKDLRFLDQIFLDHNQIEFIADGLFSSNILLQKIILNNNRIATISCAHLNGLKYLDTLQLAQNNLVKYDATCLENKLDYLNVNGNNLTQLVIRNMKSVEASNNSISEVIIMDNGNILETLIIANNSLRNIENITNLLINLETLDVSFNTVGKLNITTFSKLNKLVKLDLERTGISNLDFGTFANQRELFFLDISYNNLNKLNWDIFLPYLTKLEEFYINGNNLTEIEINGHIVHNFPQLRVLGLTNNNFNCSYLASFFRILTYSKVRMNFDLLELNDVNTTHINGVACSSAQSRVNTSTNAIPEVHLQPAHKIEFEMIKTKMEYFYRNDVTLSNKIGELQLVIYQQQQRHANLISSLQNTKYFVCGAAILALIFVALKFVKRLNENRHLNLRASGVFPSTATMNTLQSNIPY